MSGPQEFVVRSAGGWSYGDGPAVDQGEVVKLTHARNDQQLIARRYIVPLAPDAKPVTCKCGRRFLADSLAIHRARSHKDVRPNAA